MYLEQCYEYPELDYFGFDDFYKEMLEYTLEAFSKKLIIDKNGEISIPDMNDVDMGMIDLDAVRWKKGYITTEELYKQYREYYLRATT